jgi:hypothetical protein
MSIVGDLKRVRWPWRFVLGLSAAAFVTTAVLLVLQVVNSPAPSALHAKHVATSPLARCPLEQNYSEAQVSLVIRRFDVSTLTLDTDVYMCLPEGLVSRLQIEDTEALQLAPLRPSEYQRVHVGVEYGGMRRDTTLAAFVGYNGRPGFGGHPGMAGNHTVWLGEFPFPVTGAPRRYPLDWYAVQGHLAINIPEIARGVFAGPLPEPHAAVMPDLPFHLTVLDSPTVRPFSLSAKIAKANDGAHIDLLMTRTASSIAYVVSVIAVAVAIALLFTLVLFTSPRARQPEPLVGVAAVLLAILPIRVVLVPGDITEVTFVDYGLAVVIASIALVACIAAARSTAPARHH